MWNLESWALESKIQYLKSGIQDCLGCAHTGAIHFSQYICVFQQFLTDSSHHSKGYKKDKIMRKWWKTYHFTSSPSTFGSRFSSGTSTSSMKISPVTDALKENFPSILGAESPFIPWVKTKKSGIRRTMLDCPQTFKF